MRLRTGNRQSPGRQSAEAAGTGSWFATPPPIHTLRRGEGGGIPEELENVDRMALQKDPEKRYKTGLDFGAELTRVHQKLRAQYNRIAQQETVQPDAPKLKFSTNSRMVKSGSACAPAAGRTMPNKHPRDRKRTGEMDDRLNIHRAGEGQVQRLGRAPGTWRVATVRRKPAMCGARRRTATIKAIGTCYRHEGDVRRCENRSG